MSKVTPQEYQKKHASNLKASVPYITAGVEKVTESPTLKAAAAQDKMLYNLTQAVNNGKWAKGLKRVTVEEWRSKMINKGIPRIAVGIDEAADKVVAFATQLLPHIDKGQQVINKMPDVTLDDSINRMVAWTRHMDKFKRTD